MKAKQPAKNADLDSKEWCFRSISTKEADACYVYEYLRELIRRSPSNGRKDGRAIIATKVVRFWGMDEHSLSAADIILNTPWQDLGHEAQSILSRRVANRNLISLTMEPENDLDITNIKEFRERYGSWQNSFDSERTEYGFFAINWRFADRDLKRTFDEWLAERRKEVERRGWTKPDYKAKGRGGSVDRLNWLGALRVVEHYRRTDTQLVDYADTNLKIDAPYSHLPDLRKNAKKARKLLTVMSGLI
jgi:hypothetical protein